MFSKKMFTLALKNYYFPELKELLDFSFFTSTVITGIIGILHEL